MALPSAAVPLSKRSVTFHDFCELTEGLRHLSSPTAVIASGGGGMGVVGGGKRSPFGGVEFSDRIITEEILIEEEECGENDLDEGIATEVSPSQPSLSDHASHHYQPQRPQKEAVKHSKEAGGKRGTNLPLNTPSFSSWLQLFLSICAMPFLK